MREWWSKLRRAASRRALDEELAEEMRAHAELMADDRLEQGLPPHEARAAARRSFGNMSAIQERARDAWRFPRFESLLQDLRYGLRAIRKSPGFSLVVILTLALGIGANTAIFSLVYSVLLRSLPYPSGDRLVMLGENSGKATGISVTWINYQHWRTENHTFEDMAALINGADLTMTGRGETVLTHGALVTSNYFHLTGARPIHGRLLTPDDDRTGAPPAVLLSYDFWNTRLGANPHVVESSLALNGKAYTIVGILRPEISPLLPARDYYLPLRPTERQTLNRNAHGSIRALGLLKTGVTLARARTNLDEIMQRLAASDPGPETDHRAFAQFLTERITGGIRPTLLVLMGAVGLVLLLACANIASLLLVRGAARSHEMAIRTAIGAGRMRLARQLFTENLVLAAVGGVGGVALAAWCLRALVLSGPSGLPRLAEVRLDLPVLLFAAAATILADLLAGLAPVLTAARTDLAASLKEGSQGAGTGPRSQTFRNALVAAEVAITVVLAFASGLLIRSLIAAQSAYPGFDSHGLLALELQLPPSRYKAEARVLEYYSQLQRDLEGLPGVESVAAVGCPPSMGYCGDYWYSILDRPAPPRENVPLTRLNIADTGYFRAMHTRLLAGREFNAEDRPGTPPVTVINEELARKWWPSPQLAIGHLLKMGGPYMDGPALQIVGVVGNFSLSGLDSLPEPEFYFAFQQHTSQAMVMMIRTAREPATLIPAVRRRVAALDAAVPIQSLRPFESWLNSSLERRRFTTLLLAVFAALAMILAAVGIYGVLNYWVNVRQREIAIRLAIGAPRTAILRWGAAHTFRLVAGGMVVGALLGWVSSRWLKSLVFGISEHNPGMMLTAAAVVLGVAAMAAGFPLWRATRVDAVRNLHEA
jgi:putative ABC transport system permease protein